MTHTPIYFSEDKTVVEIAATFQALSSNRFFGRAAYQFPNVAGVAFGVDLYADLWQNKIAFHLQNITKTIPFESLLPSIQAPYFSKIPKSVATLTLSWGRLNSSFTTGITPMQFIAGGVSNSNNARWGEMQEYRKAFLTNQPRLRQTDALTPNSLYWLANHATVSATLQCEITYTDTSSQTLTLATQNIESGYVYHINTSARNILLLSDPAKKIERYEVFLLSSGVEISERIAYAVYPFCDTHTITRVIFKNSFGHFDTLFLTGQRTEEIVTERLTARTSDTNFSYHSQYNKRIKVNTGEQSQAFFACLPDLFLSKEIYYLEKGLFVPLTIESTSGVAFRLFEKQPVDLSFLSSHIHENYLRL